MSKSARTTCVLGVCFLALATTPVSAGLHDQGMVEGALRTEYPQGLGAGANWLTLWYVGNGLPGAEGCLFDANENLFGCPGRAGLPTRPDGLEVWEGAIQRYNACHGDPSNRIGDSWVDCISYDASPLFTHNAPGSTYWVVSANEEPAFDQCQPGPPNHSHPVNDLFSGGPEALYNVTTSDSVNVYFRGKRVHLKVNNSAHDFSCSVNGGPSKVELTQPFLAVGAQSGAGNVGDLGNLQRGSSTAVDRLRFRARIKSHDVFTCDSGPDPACGDSVGPGVHAGLFVITEWGGFPRLLFVQLFRDGVLAAQPQEQTSFWNWPVYSSFYWPGGEVGVITADVARGCDLTVADLVPGGSTINYDIDLTDLFECVGGSEPKVFTSGLPTGSYPIRGVHFYIESANATDGSLEMTIDRVFLD